LRRTHPTIIILFLNKNGVIPEKAVCGLNCRF